LWRRDSVPVWCGHAGEQASVIRQPPNPPLQLTASRARSFGFEVIGSALTAAECQTVGPPPSIAVLLNETR